MVGDRSWQGLRVACLGEGMLELRTRPDGLLTRAYGGDTLNTAVYLARLGVAVDFVSALGEDDLSAEMLEAWAAEGVGTAHVRRLPGTLPGLYIIETDPAGERRFLYWRDSAPVRRIFDRPHAEATAAALADAGLVYLSGITLSLFVGAARERLFAALERVRAGGGRVAFDTNFRVRGWPERTEARDAYARILALSDVVIAGVEDFDLLASPGAGPETPEAILARLERAGVADAVVKLAAPGCLVRCGGLPETVPAQAAVPVDTTAAGDSFAAGYLAGRLAGRGPAESARAGHRLAGTVIRHPGAIIPRAAMPADI